MKYLYAVLALFVMCAPAYAAGAGQAVPQACYDTKTDAASLKAQVAGCTLLLASPSPGDNIAGFYLNRGIAHRKLGENALAVADYTQHIKLMPDDVRGYNGLCFARALMGQLKVALADCNKALSLVPDDRYTLDTRGFVNVKLGLYDAAIADYDAELAQSEKFPESYFGRGIAKIRKGDKAGGAADIASAKALDSNIAAEMAKIGLKP